MAFASSICYLVATAVFGSPGTRRARLPELAAAFDLVGPYPRGLVSPKVFARSDKRHHRSDRLTTSPELLEMPGDLGSTRPVGWSQITGQGAYAS
jgi:hypothetical protein